MRFLRKGDGNAGKSISKVIDQRSGADVSGMYRHENGSGIYSRLSGSFNFISRQVGGFGMQASRKRREAAESKILCGQDGRNGVCPLYLSGEQKGGIG